MKTTIDKAGRVVIPASVREKAGFAPGTELQVVVDEISVRLIRTAPGPRRARRGKRIVARPTARRKPVIDLDALIDEERNRWPF